MKPVLKYSIALLAIIIAVISVIFSHPAQIQAPENAKITEQEVKPPSETVRPVNYQYSRVTFFNSQPVRASLAIPDYWEGQYRLKEQGNEASFYYIEDRKETPLMSFFLVKEGDARSLDVNSLLAGKKDGYLAFYRFYDKKIAIDRENKALETMYQDIDMVIDSLKLR